MPNANLFAGSGGGNAPPPNANLFSRNEEDAPALGGQNDDYNGGLNDNGVSNDGHHFEDVGF